MSPLQNTGARRVDALAKENAALKRTLRAVRAAGSQEAVHDVLDAFEEETGTNTETITMEALAAGEFSAEQLADRLDEVQAVMSGQSPGGPATAADIRQMTPEQIAAMPGGAERAMALINAENDR